VGLVVVFGTTCPGPDEFGYVCLDSLRTWALPSEFQAAHNPPPTYQWEETAANNPNLFFPNDNSINGPFPLPMSFPFYGHFYDQIWIASNGWISFVQPQGSQCWCNPPIFPSGATPFATIALFWADYFTGTSQGAGGVISYLFKNNTEAPFLRDHFIVQFTNVPHQRNSTAVITMQVKLFFDNGEIQVHYATMLTDTTTHSGAIQNSNGTDGLTFKYGPYPVESNSAVKYFIPIEIPTTGTTGVMDSVKSSSKPPPMAAIIGGAVGGGVAFIILVVILACVALRRSGRSSQKKPKVELEHKPPGSNFTPSITTSSSSMSSGAPLIATNAKHGTSPSPGGPGIPHYDSLQNKVGSSSGPGGKRSSMKTKNWVIDYNELQFERELGRGAFGVVWLAAWRMQHVAVKLLSTDQGITQKDIEDFKSEGELYMSLRPHKNVVTFYGVCVEPMCIVTEYLPGGSLSAFLRSDAKIELPMIISMAMEVAAGMTHLHYEGVIHRDLSARNLLLDKELIIKIADFGMSRIVTNQQGYDVTKSDVGPLKWMAPEAIIDRTYSTKTDVYAFAITMIEMLTREEPYQGMSAVNVAIAVTRDNRRPEVPYYCPPDLLALITRCWSVNPAERPEFKDAYNVLYSISLQYQ